ncbi:MAG: hypothetical protein CBD18_01350 [Opitutales bacterium TMED158]|nr:MAG: hypothetical protein CBD18_01350 [Opitutales bacterium TMED158]
MLPQWRVDFKAKSHCSPGGLRPGSVPPGLCPLRLEGNSYLSLSLAIDPRIQSCEMNAEFGLDPTFFDNSIESTLVSEIPEGSRVRFLFRAATPVADQTIFIRLAVTTQ